MRHSDKRSRRIAVVPETLMNAHLTDTGLMSPMRHFLEEGGYGVIQLPPSDAPSEVIDAAIRFVVDQVQDYLKNSYEVVEVSLEAGSDEASRIFRETCRSRGIAVARFSVASGLAEKIRMP